MTDTLPLTVTFRRAVPADFAEVRRVTRDAYLRAGHFSADHPYMKMLEDVEHRAEHAQVLVAEAAGEVAASMMLTFEARSRVTRKWSSGCWRWTRPHGPGRELVYYA